MHPYGFYGFILDGFLILHIYSLFSIVINLVKSYKSVAQFMVDNVANILVLMSCRDSSFN